MAKKGEVVIHVTLACTECGERNYHTKRNKRNTPGKLQLKKYCRHCQRHTLHKEV